MIASANSEDDPPWQRVVLLREQLEDREIANYLPLRQTCDLSLVSSDAAGPYSATGLGIPVRVARSVDSLPCSRVVRRVSSRVLGERVDLDRLYGLPHLLDDAGIVVVNETHMASSAQVCELRRARPELRVVTVCYENIPFRYEDVERLGRRKDLVRRWTDRFIALTPEAESALLEEGVEQERIVVQPYGVDVSRFGPEHRSTELRNRWGARGADDVVIMFTGRLLREKGLVELVRAVSHLGDGRARLVLVGAGPEQGRISRAAASLGLDSLVLEEWADPDDIPRMLASADVFALPSLPTPYWEEQLGFSAIEAMATGLPVLGVASGSIPFVVGAGGVLVAPYDVRSLTCTLRDLVDSDDLRSRLGAAGRRRAVDDLNTVRVAERLGSVLAATMPRSGGAP